MTTNMQGRVDITLRCKPDYSRPEKDAGIDGFVIDWDGELGPEVGTGEIIEFWADDPKDNFWRVARAKQDYVRIYSELMAMSKGRSNLSKLLKPVFKYAEEHQLPVYVCGVRCCQFEAVGETPATDLPVTDLPVEEPCHAVAAG